VSQVPAATEKVSIKKWPVCSSTVAHRSHLQFCRKAHVRIAESPKGPREISGSRVVLHLDFVALCDRVGSLCIHSLCSLPSIWLREGAHIYARERSGSGHASEAVHSVGRSMNNMTSSSSSPPIQQIPIHYPGLKRFLLDSNSMRRDYGLF
jgi:hypothetical protein